MNQPLTPEHLAEIRELATRSAPSSYEALTSHRGIEVFAVDPDDCKERIATATPDRKDFVYLAVQAPTAVLALLGELDRVRAERDAFADRVDTLTAVAKGNKRRVQSVHTDRTSRPATAREFFAALDPNAQPYIPELHKDDCEDVTCARCIDPTP